jgi:heme O synthase-like polyprenyltransferase
MISSLTVLFILALLLILVVTALVLASKSKSNIRFLIWAAFILCIPFIGAGACILSYYTNRNNTETT